MAHHLAALAFIGRYGTQGFVISLLLGLAVQPLAAVARPFLGVTVFIFLLMTFTRVRLGTMLGVARAPFRLALACLCIVLTPIVIITAVFGLVGRASLDPGLVLGLALFAAAPPIMSAPAIAMMIGIEPVLVTAAVVLITALSPLISPFIVDFVAGAAVPLDPTILLTRLVGIVGGAFAAGIMLRAALGAERVRRHSSSFDGVGVLMYFVFAIAAMDGVLAAITGEPGRVALFLAIAVSLSVAGQVVSWLVLRPIPKPERLIFGYATGQRNMGLLIAALGAATPDTTFLYFALAQVPIYVGPYLIGLAAGRLGFGRPL